MPSTPAVEPYLADRGPRARTPLFRRRVWVAAVVVLALPLYWLAANVLLASGAVAAIVNSGKDVHVEFDSAWSWFPGSMSVEGVRVRIEDKNVQAYLEIDRADVRFSMLQLVTKTFHATRVRATGARFYFRHRVPIVTDDNARRIAAYPAIPGLDAIPLAQAGPEAIGISPDVKSLWKVELDDVDATADELWFQEYRYRGRAVAKGSFRLEPMQRVRVGPASLELSPGTLTAEPFLVSTDFAGRVDVTVHEFEVQKERGAMPLHFIDARVGITGKIPSLDVLALYMTDPRVEGGPAQLRADVRFTRGAFDEGSDVHLDLTEVRLPAKGISFVGPLSVSALAPSRGVLVVGADSARLAMSMSTAPASTPFGSIHEATARAEIAALDLAAVGPTLSSGKLHVAAGVERLRDLFAALGATEVRRGTAKLGLDATLRGEVVSATYTANVGDVDLSLGDGLSAVADATVRGAATGDRALSEVTLEDLQLRASRFGMRRGSSETSHDSWLQISVPRVRVTSAGAAPCIAFASDIAGGNSGSFAALVDVGALRGIIAGALSNTPVRAHAHGTVVGSRAEVEFDSVRAGTIQAQGLVVGEHGPPSGAFLLEIGALDGGVDLHSGSVTVKPLASIDWYEHRAATLRGPRPCPLPK